ncbi:hypothetical protein FCL53_10750 [Elizabethkingia meningoseptica]|uniref:hypothetical protein n=1 Tax=Elizabethkingia meningoseptica TaxID=238 RepID=UPI0013663DA7|nr:hypothetical protein [Elizabethkingia meningoseptica]MVW92443.1 hypothetical protein [Elizabethkingia meningoseptica]
MEAKDKAEELVNKFENVELLKDYSGMWSPLAIECATICIDEMLTFINVVDPNNICYELIGEREFLTEVKSELEKMK